MRIRPFFLIAMCGMALSVGCSGVNVVPKGGKGPGPRTPLARIAVLPGAEEVGDAVASSLADRGHDVLAPQQTLDLMQRSGIPYGKMLRSSYLSAFKAQGVDAYVHLDVKYHPETNEVATVDVRVTETDDGALIKSFTWYNSWGGMRGSIADAIMRKSRSGTGAHIGKTLAPMLGS